MSKKITHEQVGERKQNIITKQIALSSDIYSVRLIPISADETNIKEMQDFIDKQQKLLELYKKIYNGCTDYHDYEELKELQKQIKELEND